MLLVGISNTLKRACLLISNTSCNNEKFAINSVIRGRSRGGSSGGKKCLIVMTLIPCTHLLELFNQQNETEIHLSVSIVLKSGKVFEIGQAGWVIRGIGKGASY